MDVGNYLFGFNGRVNRAKWWIYVLIYIVYVVVMNYVVLTNFALNFWIYFALLLPIWFVGIAVGIKRLHDRDKGAIWALLFYGVPFAISCYTSYVSWGSTAAAMALAQARTPEELQAAAQAAQEAAQGALSGMGSMYWVLAAIQLIILIWAIVELGILQGTKGDNQYGPDPLANVVH